LAGLIVFVAMVATCFRSALQSYRRLQGSVAPQILTRVAFALIAALAGFCVAGSFLTQGFNWPIYVLVGLTSALARNTNKLT
jgi:putative inorganic carbon (HCO3(-)) transporter